MGARETWPKEGPDFNRWELDFIRLAALLEDASDECWWSMDPPLKYLEIRVDVRDCGFILKDREGNRIDPQRVVTAIEKWRKEIGDGKLGLRPQSAGYRVLAPGEIDPETRERCACEAEIQAAKVLAPERDRETAFATGEMIATAIRFLSDKEPPAKEDSHAEAE